MLGDRGGRRDERVRVGAGAEGVRFLPPRRSTRAAGVGVHVRAAVSAVSHCLAVGPLWRRRGRGERTAEVGLGEGWGRVQMSEFSWTSG